MYHRFHAPHDATMEHCTYISGDTWNVNPIALKRVQRLFCLNERAVLRLRLDDGTPLALVPVAAVLVASMRFHFLDVVRTLRQRGANETPCHAPLAKGQEWVARRHSHWGFDVGLVARTAARKVWARR